MLLVTRELFVVSSAGTDQWLSIEVKWLMGEMQIPSRKVMPWLEDLSRKVVGSIARASKGFYLAKSVKSVLVRSYWGLGTLNKGELYDVLMASCVYLASVHQILIKVVFKQHSSWTRSSRKTKFIMLVQAHFLARRKITLKKQGQCLRRRRKRRFFQKEANFGTLSGLGMHFGTLTRLSRIKYKTERILAALECTSASIDKNVANNTF